MDVTGSRLSTPGSDRVVSRPHVPAFLWYGFSALLLSALVAVVFLIARWDGTLTMLVPICLLVAFGIPLVLVLRNLTAIAIVEPDAVELRYFFMRAWRLQRPDIMFASPTPGIVEGSLQLYGSGTPSRRIPGFLMRGLRHTWVYELRNARPGGVVEGMSRDEKRRYAEATRRIVVERDETFGTTPEARWKNASLWHKQQRFINYALVGLTLISLALPMVRDVWLLDALITCFAVGISLDARLRYRGLRRSIRETSLVLCSLLPGFIVSRGQYNWQLLDPGLGTMAVWLAGVIWIMSLMPPWRGVTWSNRARYTAYSVFAAGLMAYWGYELLAFANMRFDGTTKPVVEIASVDGVEHRPASRSTPATIEMKLGITPTFSTGVTARFPLYAVPAGTLEVGKQCVLLLRPGLFHVRWLQVALCH